MRYGLNCVKLAIQDIIISRFRTREARVAVLCYDYRGDIYLSYDHKTDFLAPGVRELFAVKVGSLHFS